MDVPLVGHVSKLVRNLATRPAAGRDNGEDLADEIKILRGETDGKVTRQISRS